MVVWDKGKAVSARPKRAYLEMRRFVLACVAAVLLGAPPPQAAAQTPVSGTMIIDGIQLAEGGFL